VVSAIKGDVHATYASKDVALKVGASLDLPISIRVGADGALELHQGLTVISAAANSQLQIPKAVSSEETLDKIVQSQGNVYYGVAKRPTHKLRVETPLLVAIIKGTRFNVAALDASTTISLLEGSIEVRATDDSGVVDLSAGQMATRSRSQPAIQVIRMSTGELIRGSAPTAASLEQDHSAHRGSPGQGNDGSTGSASVIVSNQAQGSERTSATQTSAVTNGVVSGQGDDHGASSSLTLNQLVTRASSSSGASNSTGGASGSGVDSSTGSSTTTPGGTSGPTASGGNSGVGVGAGPSGTSGPTGSGGGLGGTSSGGSGNGGGNSNAGGSSNGGGNSGVGGNSNGGVKNGTSSTGDSAGSDNSLNSALQSLLKNKKK
jgi:hypothetical protein